MSWLQTLEGYYIFDVLNDSTTNDSTTNAFALTQRTGQVDLSWRIGREVEGEKLIWPFPMEKALLSNLKHALEKLGAMSVEPPFVVAASVLGVRGYQLRYDRWEAASRAAWRDQFRLPEILIEAAEEKSLLPLVESFWFAMCEERPKAQLLGGTA